MQHQQQYPPAPQNPQQQQQPPFQTASYQQTQSRQSAVVQANGPINPSQYVKSEQMSQAPAQGLDSVDNQTNDGWGDFDWNDNNQGMQGVVGVGVDDGLKHVSQNLIEESFKTEPNDNWQWSVEEKPAVSLPGEHKRQDNANSYPNPGRQDVLSDSPVSQNYDGRYPKPDLSPVLGRQDLLNDCPEIQSYDDHSYNPGPFAQPFGQHPVSIQSLKSQPNQQMVHSTPVSTPQRNQQILSQDTALENTQHLVAGNVYLPTSKSLEGGQNPGSVPHSKPAENSQNSVGSPVYVSQAKPVAQPPRQYAISPSVSGESTPILQPAAGTKSLPPAPNQVVNPVPVVGNATAPHPANSQSPGLANLPPPPSQTPPQLSSSANSVLPPPPPIVQTTSAVSNNPYKRTGVAQHHRSLVGPPKSNQQPAVAPQQFFAPPPEEFQTQQNQEYLAPDNSEVVDRNFEVENQEVAPSNDRNRYLQTSHLSEEGYNNNRQDIRGIQEQNNEFDSFPPPGLSRFVLGQPEVESGQQSSGSQSDIPPGLDRMIPGTELVASDLNMERQADGQDTIPSPRSAFTNMPPVEDNSSANIDITADRNLYLVPGESDVQVQRVVTGVENGLMGQGAEQREVELDGENLEDQQQQQLQQHLQQQQHQGYQHEVEITREEPIEGANTLDGVGGQSANHETESNLTLDTNLKDLSNASTGNDESDHRDRNAYLNKSKRSEDKKRRPEDKRKERYDSEESDLSSERERRRYREGSVRNDRGRDSKDRDRKEKRESRERDRYHDEEDGSDRRFDRDRRRDKYDRERDRGRFDRDRDRNRYETDSRYETEGSVRYERRRNDRDRDRDRDRYDNEYRRDEKDRRYRRDRRGDDREDRERDRRRGDREYRDDRDRRRERDLRDKNRSDYDEDYRKSRNEREKDRLREKDPRYAHMYNYPPGYSYDMYYQQQQKYYEQLRRTNPQAYSEWYHKYYAQIQGQDMMTNDGRESVHSGRSSANNDKERYSIQAVRQYLQQPNDYHRSSLNSSMIADASTYNLGSGPSTGNLSQHLQHHQLPGGYLIPTSNRSYYAQSEYSETTRHENMSINLLDESMSIQDPQRSTPCKFTNEHPSVSLSAGIFVCVKPKYSQNGTTNIVKILKLGANDSNRRLFQTFPGPLIRGLTHKKTIIEFCEDQIRLGPPSMTLRSRQNSVNSICSVGQANKASFTLMWNLLILLLRQNGMVVGTDIAELLMKNKVQFPYDIQTFASKPISRRDSVQSDVRKSKENSPSDAENEVEPNDNSNGHTSDENDGKEALSEEEITEKFRNYLLYGNVNEALEWATDNNLWGHALFLASKVDRRSHANVMMKFANKLALNDPLQTLYQLMSGRSPSSVTSIQDEKWGDWRPHLAMILSNTSQKPELNRKAITTLGDSLYNRGDLFGAQFCYLMAQVEFGRYSAVNQDSTLMPNLSSAIRLVLLGSSQHKAFKEFATNEAIMMTEIYEYACSLNDDKFSIVEFQPYKYLLALRMLDYGFQMKTLMYMEQIALHIQRDPSKYDSSFIEKVYKLADRLKYYDPVLEKTIDDQQDGNQSFSGLQFEDQQWIQDLRNILTESNAANGFTQSNSYGYDYNNGQVQQPSNELDNKTLIDQQFAEINQQFSELSMQYNNFDPTQQLSGGYQLGNEAEYQQQQQQQQPQPQQQISNQTHDQYGEFYGSKPMYNNVQDGSNAGYGNGVVQSGYMQPQQTAYDPQNQVPEQHQVNQGYDGYWGNQQQHQQQNQQQSEIQRPSISMPNSMSSKPGFYDDSQKDENSSHDLGNQGQTPTNELKTSASKTDTKSQNKSTALQSSNSGWFGGIWNKLSLKPKNQMILPDDKNPTIVWDPEKKRWVNTDGDSDEHESFKPPPKMSDIMHAQSNKAPTQAPNMMPQAQQAPQQVPQQQQQVQFTSTQQQSAPATVPQPAPSPMSAVAANGSASGPIEANKTPSLQSNMFKMQRNRTLKKSYVDVFNPSGAQPSKPIEPVLAPTVPPAAVPQSGFFIPAPVPADDSQQQQDGVPQFYNPNQFGGYQQ